MYIPLLKAQKKILTPLYFKIFSIFKTNAIMIIVLALNSIFLDVKWSIVL
jgi:hypothetical protein